MECSKCNGSGKYQNFGVCFRCGGTGVIHPKTTKTAYKVGDRIQHNTSKNIYEIKEVMRTKYKVNKYASDGLTLLCDIGNLGKHITNYPESDPKGYTKVN
jgi:RecJ-like exonuclease